MLARSTSALISCKSSVMINLLSLYLVQVFFHLIFRRAFFQCLFLHLFHTFHNFAYNLMRFSNFPMLYLRYLKSIVFIASSNKSISSLIPPRAANTFDRRLAHESSITFLFEDHIFPSIRSTRSTNSFICSQRT